MKLLVKNIGKINILTKELLYNKINKEEFMNNKIIGFLLVFSIFSISKAFCGPFGLDFGMTYEQVSNISKTEPINIKEDYYLITPPNTNDQFEVYVVCIHPKCGIYLIKAVSKDINSNAQGTALRSRFNDLVSTVEKTYGKCKKEDFAVKGSYWGNQPDYYMYALARDERVLMATWGKKEGSKLPPEILAIFVEAKAENSSTGYLIIEYYSKNYDIIKAEQESVF